MLASERSVTGRTSKARSDSSATATTSEWRASGQAPCRLFRLPEMTRRHTFCSMIPEEIDLQQLAHELRHALKPGDPVGYLRGKALMRDVLVHERQFSELEAEELID